MIEGMSSTEIGEYFAMVRELEPDVALPGLTPAVAVADPAECSRLAELCDQLPKVDTRDDACAQHRAEFNDFIRGLRCAGVAVIITGVLLAALAVYWRMR